MAGSSYDREDVRTRKVITLQRKLICNLSAREFLTPKVLYLVEEGYCCGALRWAEGHFWFPAIALSLGVVMAWAPWRT